MINRFVLAAVFAVASTALVLAQATTVVVEPTLSNQIAGWLGATITAAVPIVTGFLANLLWSQSKLSRMIFSQKMLEKLNAGIIAFIRAEVERRRLAVDPVLTARAEVTAAAIPLSPETKADIVAAVQPKIEEAFKTTLKHFGKEPGTEQVSDMIFGRMREALAKPVEVPHVVSK